MMMRTRFIWPFMKLEGSLNVDSCEQSTECFGFIKDNFLTLSNCQFLKNYVSEFTKSILCTALLFLCKELKQVLASRLEASMLTVLKHKFVFIQLLN